MTRQAVYINRKAITVLSDNGLNCGGWFAYAPTEPAPKGVRVKENERLLYCPYCGKWSIFKRKPDDMDTFKCTGWCGWANTNDFHVKKFNKLWRVEMKKTNHLMVPKELDTTPRMVGTRRRKR